MRAILLGCLFVLPQITLAGLIYKTPSDKDTVTFFSKASKEELDPNHINIMVWNQYKGKEDHYRREYGRLSRDQDVMILQEGFIDGKMDKVFASDRHFEGIFAASFVYRFSKKETGVITSSRAIASTYEAQRSVDKEIVGGTPKMVLFTTYALKGRSDELMAVNIHALNSVTWQTLARQVLDALRVIRNHDGPVIFAGDFNTWSKTKYNFVMNAMKNAGLTEVKFRNEELKMKVFGRALDHAFVRGAKVIDASVEKSDGADHQPLFVKLSIN